MKTRLQTILETVDNLMEINAMGYREAADRKAREALGKKRGVDPASIDANDEELRYERDENYRAATNFAPDEFIGPSNRNPNWNPQTSPRPEFKRRTIEEWRADNEKFINLFNPAGRNPLLRQPSTEAPTGLLGAKIGISALRGALASEISGLKKIPSGPQRKPYTPVPPSRGPYYGPDRKPYPMPGGGSYTPTPGIGIGTDGLGKRPYKPKTPGYNPRPYGDGSSPIYGQRPGLARPGSYVSPEDRRQQEKLSPAELRRRTEM